jgi:hypothetical protein
LPNFSVTVSVMVTSDGVAPVAAAGACHVTLGPVPVNVPAVALQAYCN